MSNPWFRLYTETLNNPKAQKLPGDLFKTWINLLCVASENEGVLPPMEDTAFKIRASLDETLHAIKSLVTADLITVIKNQHGEVYAPKNWHKRQYKSDSSNERVKRHREKKRAEKETVTVTPPEQSRTDTEKKDIPKKEYPKKTKVQKPDDVAGAVWEDFLKLRQAKKAPVTGTVIKNIRREAEKAGMAFEEALALMCARGWQGFEAQWIENERKKNGNGTHGSGGKNGDSFAPWREAANRKPRKDGGIVLEGEDVAGDNRGPEKGGGNLSLPLDAAVEAGG